MRLKMQCDLVQRNSYELWSFNGIEIARTEWYRREEFHHTLDADIDYGFSEAKTTYGIIGIKCGYIKVTDLIVLKLLKEIEKKNMVNIASTI